MSDIAVRVDHLSKRYNIGWQQNSYRTLRDSLVAAAGVPLRWLRGERRRKDNTIWALDDISFEVRQGEAVGIIGNNGAGKSTLLKVLSRITKPTRGRIELYGRVGSLLEVGTGFHPELTGRDNIYLNGAILGMRRQEIMRKFDEIVAFAEIEKFLDTPVKYYSSGMYVRLAFAVAANLEPDILVVDEVLAVGDAEFQKKCLGKMGEVEKQGRTVLFVSHNIAAMLSLCSTSILLKSGQIETCGPARMVAEHYLASGIALSGEVQFPKPPLQFDKPFLFQKVALLRSNGDIGSQIDLLEGVTVEITFQIIRPLKGIKISCRLRNAAGVYILSTSDIDESPLHRLEAERAPGIYVARCQISRQFLRQGRFTIDIWAGYPSIRTLDEYIQVIAFDVVDTGSLEALIGEGNSDSILSPVLPWVTVEVDQSLPLEMR